MAGTITFSGKVYKRNCQKLVFGWVSDASGDATYTTTQKFTGQVKEVKFISDATPNNPTTAYDVVINDSDGVDILNGVGADIVSTTDENTASATGDSNGNRLGSFVDSTLSLVVSNAGNAKSGTVIIYFG